MNAIAIVIVSAVIFMGILLIIAVQKIDNLEKAKQNLKKDNSRLSNALRKKGIEVDGLEKKIKRLEKNAEI